MNLLGMDGAADAVCHLDVEFGEDICCTSQQNNDQERAHTLISASFAHITNSGLLDDVLDQKSADSLILKKLGKH